MGSDDGNTDYEAIRKQRLEENQRRMQELGISELSQSLSKTVQKSNSKPVKQRLPKDDFPVEVRRSSRVMDGPRPNYSDAAFDFHLPRKSGPRIARLPMRYASDTERIKAAERANKSQEELQGGNPSFVKLMLVSHVSGGFWLGLPRHFCKKNLPKSDGVIVLEDEKGEEWDTILLARRPGLSGGWGRFAMDHSLEDGDALIFELIQPQRFKVHIIRVSDVASENDNKENVVSSKGGQKRKSREQNVKTLSAEKLVNKGTKRPKVEVSELEPQQRKVKAVNWSPLSPKEEVSELEPQQGKRKAVNRSRLVRNVKEEVSELEPQQGKVKTVNWSPLVRSPKVLENAAKDKENKRQPVKSEH